MKIGITGGMGSGKTTVCSIFESMGVPVYYADVMAKKILISNKEVKMKIKNLLGEKAYYKNGRPDRTFIASKVFTDKRLLESLNAIVHPAVHHDFENFYIAHKDKAPYILNEAALLVENGSFKRFEKLIVVTCPEKIRIQRIQKRDKTTIEVIQKRLQNQLPEEEKIKHADFIVNNSGEKALIPQIWEIHQKLIK
ncbi:MAG: dephospho-CoA kinase [Saprospiraceae bacterium]|nr:dephospho-CoA kinase [Saprospiraceae bacterium]